MNMQEMHEALEGAEQTIKVLEEQIKALTAPPYVYGTIVKVYPKTLVVVVDGRGVSEVARPPAPTLKGVRVGMVAKINAKTGMVVDVASTMLMSMPATVEKVVNEDFVQVEVVGGQRVIVWQGGFTVTPKQAVWVDRQATVITGIPPQEATDQAYLLETDTQVTWEMIGGQQEAVETLREAIELPRKYAGLYKKFGKRPIKGVLLYGPPGCGKTLIAKAAASALATLNGNDALSRGFYYVKGPEVLVKWVGDTEAIIRGLFAQAREYQQRHGHPAVIFFDEADALLGKRGSGKSSDVERTIVPQFLSEMDGLEANGAMVLLATNRPDTLDPAVVRDGRVDRKVKVRRPTHATAGEIFEMYLKKLPLAEPVETLTAGAVREVFSATRTVRVVESGGARFTLTLGHLISGAMIAGIVDQATTVAIRRCIANKRADQRVCAADLHAAVELHFAAVKDLDHTEAVVDHFGEGAEVLPEAA